MEKISLAIVKAVDLKVKVARKAKVKKAKAEAVKTVGVKTGTQEKEQRKGIGQTSQVMYRSIMYN